MLRVSRLTAVVAVCLISNALCSCSNITNHSKSPLRRVASPTEVAAPLSSHIIRPELLASINSIEVIKPSIATSAGIVEILADDAQKVIEQVARETLNLKVLSPTLGSRLKATTEVSRKNGKADAQVVTDLLRYEERRGSAIGGESAVISFRMKVVTFPDGVPVWEAQYFFRQEALSENLLKINERVGRNGLGAGWRSAHDLFEIGVSSALQDFSGKREQRFLAVTR